MMELYIQIRDGQPYEHPILGDNFRAAFPHVDVNNLPPEFAKFERVEPPERPGGFRIHDVRYEFVDGVVKDVFYLRDMTSEEIAYARLAEIDLVAYKIKQLKIAAQDRLDNPDLPEERRVIWENYLRELNEFVLVDPFNPNIPALPMFMKNNMLVSIYSSGSAPNVIE